MNKKVKKQIISYISYGKIGEAIELAVKESSKIDNKKLQKDITLLNFRYYKYVHDIQVGLSNDRSVLRQIANGLLQLIEKTEIKKKKKKIKKKKKKIKRRK